jgi:DNA modification methylase
MDVINQEITEQYAAYHGDCCEVMKGIPDHSVHFSIYSPPFSSLYTYSNSDRDMGNSKNYDEFFTQYRFLVKEHYRTMMPGRIVAVHCMNIPLMKERDGYIGIKDFRGDIIRLFESEGFILHSEHVIWKDPLVEATRTKALGLMHKQLCKDSSMSRAGLPDYLLGFRKPGDNPERVEHPKGLETFAGEDPPKTGNRSHEYWRRYASPVWMDINQSNTLQKASARDEKDERHICPLQLDVIERAIQLWTNEGDTVLTPFGGIGSEGYVAVKMKRRAVLIELKESYFGQLIKNMREAARNAGHQKGLF